MSPRFIIYRIIGNALPPRHGPTDTLDHLKHIQEIEPPLPDCEKRWLLNRFVYPEIEKKCIDLIKAKGEAYHVIPFDRDAYLRTYLDASGMPREHNPLLPAEERSPLLRAMIIEWILRHKSQYLIHINQARNKALELGMAQAEWTLPLDGSCYFTRESWDRFVTCINAASDETQYGILPLKRLSKGGTANMEEGVNYEPQIAFRKSAPDRFDERLRYGNRNKAELLERIEVPGEWHGWEAAEWDRPPPLQAVAPHQFVMCSPVFRAAPGAHESVETSNDNRFASRFMGVRLLALRVDAELICSQWATKDVFLAPLRLAVRDQILQEAQKIISRPPRLITSKKAVPPSGDMRDYISAPRYRHFVQGHMQLHDGLSHEAAILGTQASLAFDRTSLQECLTSVATLTLAGLADHSTGYFEQAASLLDAWFISPDTSMNPHGRYAQYNIDKPETHNPFGMIDFRDLWLLPRVATILKHKNALTSEQFAALKKWLAAFLDHLDNSEQGRVAYGHENNIGTWMCLLRVSLTLFAGRNPSALVILREACLKLAYQCDGQGKQHLELARKKPLHYSLFNATAWTLLAGLSRTLKLDLWRYRGVDGESIGAMLRLLVNNRDRFPEYAARKDFFDNWLGALCALVPADAAEHGTWAQFRGPSGPAFNDPDTGLPPQWASIAYR